MACPLEKAVAQKKRAIEAVMEALQGGAEALAGAVGGLLPLCEAAAPVLRLALDNVQSKEVFYVKEQFLTARSRLDALSAQMEDVDSEIRRGRLDARYFAVEENIRNQFRKYMDVLEAKPQFRQVKTKLFVEHFANTGGEKNLYVLYEALKGTNSFGESILDVVERYEARSRRPLEDFCVRMKELLCLGLIALLGHCALTQTPDDERDLIRDWSAKIEEVESKMKAAVEACVAAFPEQARLDARRLLLQEKEEGRSLEDTAQEVHGFLAGKYDWVRWSVRAVKRSGSGYRNWRAGEHYQHAAGQNWFEAAGAGGGDHADLVVSYSAAPRPVPRDSVREVVDGAGRKADARTVVELLEKQLAAGFVVHAVSRHKESAVAWNFPDDCHYWERHKNVALCVHSE